MAHKIDSMFYHGETPWHGLGTKVNQALTCSEAIHAASMDWRVGLQPVFANIGGVYQVVPALNAVVREDTGSILGTVGDRYEPLQNIDAFTFFDQVIGDGGAYLNTAGSLDRGRKIWISAKAPGHVIVGKDEIEKYMLLSSSHDGSSPVSVMFTPIRVVCQNTLNCALQSGKSTITVKHTASVKAKLELARAIIQSSEDYYSMFGDLAGRMIKAKMGDQDLSRMITEIYKIDPAIKAEDLPAQTIRKVETIRELAVTGKGNAPYAGTAWAGYNAVTEYEDHYSPIKGEDKEDRKADSLLFGRSAQAKQLAWNWIVTNYQLAG